MSENKPLYFGCWRNVGHYLWEPGPVPSGYDRERSGKIDGRWNESSEQSAASLYHRKGWTILGMADYTVDNRGGSNSVFLLPFADLTFDEAVAKAREYFPSVVERIEASAPIVPART
jgi:hypothetical protein